MKILCIGDPHGKFPKGIPKKVDLILMNGDIGKSNLAKEIYFKENQRDVCATRKEKRDAHDEIYFSSIKLLKRLSKKAEIYLIMGNVAPTWKRLLRGIRKIKGTHIVKNRIRTFGELRIGFLEFFTDMSWIKEFKIKDKKRIKFGKRGSKKARRVLEKFGGNVDILISHQPPYGILDKINGSNGAPKKWQGKHAGSKILLDYLKKYQPKYCVCGHIHEGKGERKIGKTKVINLGRGGWKVLEF